MRLLSALLLSMFATAIAHAQSPSRSIGHTNRGRLVDGAELQPSARVHLTHEPARWGTAELVSLIDGSVVRVGRAHSSTPPLVVGDLSRRRGGAFPPHRSHRAGRDADVGFFYVDTQGRPYPAEEFIPLAQDGRCLGERHACRLDAARTWALLAAMLRDGAPVQYVVVARYIRDLLLDEAVRQSAPSDLIGRFRLVTAPMAQSNDHRNHFHVRIYCALDDRPRCRDDGPLHPWYRYQPDADPTFVESNRARGQQRYAAELEAEPRDRVRRREIRERRAAAARARAQAAREAEARLARVRARREASRQREAETRQAEVARRRAWRERRAAAAAEARQRRDALRAMSPAERTALAREQRREAREAEAARRERVRLAMAERAETRRREAAERRAAMRQAHRDREAREAARAERRRAAYRDHLAQRRAGNLPARVPD